MCVCVSEESDKDLLQQRHHMLDFAGMSGWAEKRFMLALSSVCDACWSKDVGTNAAS